MALVLGLAGALLVVAGCDQTSPVAPVAGTSTPSTPAPDSSAPSSPPPDTSTSAVPAYTYEVVRTYPHDRGAFTQGLAFLDGMLYESTGLNGRSSLRQVDLDSGKVLKQIDVPSQYFAEGLAILGDKAYQLTWQNHVGFVYDRNTFAKEGEFSYTGEGWGLATDGHSLILSDGTDQIRFLDPTNFTVTRTIPVRFEGHPVFYLNELEYINGEIFANIWQSDDVVRIDPATGRVTGVIDFTSLLPAEDREPTTDVLNGIAYDPAGKRLFVTGKLWPKIFEVRLKPKPAQ